jgi:hypothetical protein
MMAFVIVGLFIGLAFAPSVTYCLLAALAVFLGVPTCRTPSSGHEIAR